MKKILVLLLLCAGCASAPCPCLEEKVLLRKSEINNALIDDKDHLELYTYMLTTTKLMSNAFAPVTVTIHGEIADIYPSDNEEEYKKQQELISILESKIEKLKRVIDGEKKSLGFDNE